eukprot:9501385-Pyramimonas_sp.AAC.1
MGQAPAASGCGSLPLHDDGYCSGAPGAASASSAGFVDSELNDGYAEAVLREHVCAEAPAAAGGVSLHLPGGRAAAGFEVFDFHCLEIFDVGPRIATKVACRYFPDCRSGAGCWYSHLESITEAAVAVEHVRLSRLCPDIASATPLATSLWRERAAGRSALEIHVLSRGAVDPAPGAPLPPERLPELVGDSKVD